MTKQALWPKILVAVVATIAAAVGSPGTGFSQDGTDTVGSTRLTAEETSTYFQPSIASSNATYKYRLLRYSHLNFGNRQKFEHWLDALGAKGFESAFHFPNDFFNPRDDTRLFISRVGGSPRRVLDYEIAVHRISLEADSATWMAEFDRLGAMGKELVSYYIARGVTYVVTQTTRLDGERQTWSWAWRQAGTGVSVPQFKRAASWLARRGYIPRTVGLSADQSKFYVIGVLNTTPGRETEVKLRFRRVTLSTPGARWLGHVNMQSRAGYFLVGFWPVGSLTDLLLVFAQEKVNGRTMTRRRCVLEPVLVDNQVRMLNSLNRQGTQGRGAVFIVPVPSAESPSFVLCDPDEEQ